MVVNDHEWPESGTKVVDVSGERGTILNVIRPALAEQGMRGKCRLVVIETPSGSTDQEVAHYCGPEDFWAFWRRDYEREAGESKS